MARASHLAALRSKRANSAAEISGAGCWDGCGCVTAPDVATAAEDEAGNGDAGSWDDGCLPADDASADGERDEEVSSDKADAERWAGGAANSDTGASGGG